MTNWQNKGERLTPYEANKRLIEFLENKNHLKNWVIFVLIVALIME